MCIVIVCDFINFKTNHIFLISPFFYLAKKSREKLKYLESEKSFQGEIKSIFIIYRGLAVACSLRLESASLI